MAILRDDLTERESRAEAGDSPGEADSAAPSTKALFSRPGSGRGKGRKPRPPSLLLPAGPPPPARPALPIPAQALPALSPGLSISVPDAAQKGVGVAPEINGSCPCAELGGPLQGGSGEEEKQRWLEACTRGSESTVIWAALVWEPETLARTIAPTRREEAQRGQFPFLLPAPTSHLRLGFLLSAIGALSSFPSSRVFYISAGLERRGGEDRKSGNSFQLFVVLSPKEALGP